MKNVPMAVYAITTALLCACGARPSQDEPPIVLSEQQKALISDTGSGFCIQDGLTVWTVDSSASRSIATCGIGEKLVLLGKTTRAMVSGVSRNIALVRMSSGVEGWVRTEFVVPNSILGVIVNDDVPLLSRPGGRGNMGRTIPRMTVIAIQKESAATEFLRISFVDRGSGSLSKDAYVRNAGISSLADDVNGAVLFTIASRTDNGKMKAAFLGSAISDYPRSAFIEDIRRALGDTREPVPAEIPTEAYEASFQTAMDGTAVLSVPDEQTGLVVATLKKNHTVQSVERTNQSYAVGSLSAPWYRIKNPAGWVFGISLIPK